MKKILFTTLLLTAFAGYSQVKEQQKENRQSGDITGGNTYEDGEPPINYAALDVKPEFPGGKEGLHKLVTDNIKIENLTDLNDVLILKITIFFVIEKDGTMSNIEYLNEPGYGFGPEVVRVMKNIKTKWTSGKKGDKVMRAIYILPITFKVTK